MLTFALAALALSAAPHFTATPARPAAEKVVLADTIFYCGAGGCSAGKSASRPAIVCASLAKELGPLRSFSVAGAEISPAQLEKCNARAR
jgi:hypothetical protein